MNYTLAALTLLSVFAAPAVAQNELQAAAVGWAKPGCSGDSIPCYKLFHVPHHLSLNDARPWASNL